MKIIETGIRIGFSFCGDISIVETSTGPRSIPPANRRQGLVYPTEPWPSRHGLLYLCSFEGQTSKDTVCWKMRDKRIEPADARILLLLTECTPDNLIGQQVAAPLYSYRPAQIGGPVLPVCKLSKPTAELFSISEVGMPADILFLGYTFLIF